MFGLKTCESAIAIQDKTAFGISTGALGDLTRRVNAAVEVCGAIFTSLCLLQGIGDLGVEAIHSAVVLCARERNYGRGCALAGLFGEENGGVGS